MPVERKVRRTTYSDAGRFIGLGRAAERFIIADRANREAQGDKRRLRECAHADHYGEVPCFELTFPGDPDEDAPLDEQFVALPVEQWCRSCYRFAQAQARSRMTSLRRRAARDAMMAAFRRLEKRQKENSTIDRRVSNVLREMQ